MTNLTPTAEELLKEKAKKYGIPIGTFLSRMILDYEPDDHKYRNAFMYLEDNLKKIVFATHSTKTHEPEYVTLMHEMENAKKEAGL